MARLIQNGRHVIVSSDVKSEWTEMALALGGQVIPIGPGSGYTINPLDEGVRPTHMRPEQWRQLVISRRELMLKSLCAVLRPDVPLSTRERVCLGQVVVALADGLIEPTLTAVEQLLRQPPESWPQDLHDPARNLALILGLLVHEGSLSGMFHTYTAEPLNPAAPMVVVDTSRLHGADPEPRQIAAAVTSAWIDATLRSQDGRYRIVLSEEGWDELRNPAQAQAMDERLRMTGHWRCSNWLIFHELADINQFGEAGSAHRQQVAGIITKTPTKILFRQSPQAMEMLDEFVNVTSVERDNLTTLDKGIGMWHIGESTPIAVQAIVGPGLYQLVNTDAGRYGN